MKKRILSICLALALCLGMLPATALAAPTDPGGGAGEAEVQVYVGNTNVINGGTWTTSDGGLQPCTGGGDDWNVKYESTGNNAGTLTLRGAYITQTSIWDGQMAVGIDARGVDLKIVLEGDNHVLPSGTSPDIRAVSVAPAAIIGSATFIGGSLTISGPGSLTVKAGAATTNKYGYSFSYGIYVDQDLTVQSGTITATGGTASNSYGIYISENDSMLTVIDGTVTATGGAITVEDNINVYSRGIRGNVTVEDGMVTANGGSATTAAGTANSYGIEGSVTVSGGMVNANGGDVNGNYQENSYGIEGSVTVSGGVLTATGGGTNGCGIYVTNAASITGGTVTATGGTGGSGVSVSGSASFTVGAGLAVYTGSSAENKQQLSFTPNENIANSLPGHPYFCCKKAPFTATVNVSGNANKTYDGQNVTLSASVEGVSSGLSYQWYKDDALLSGQTGQTISVKNVADSGTYKVTVSAAGATSTSTGVDITITKATPKVTAQATTVPYTGRAVSIDVKNITVELAEGDTYDPNNLSISYYLDSYGTLLMTKTPTNKGEYFFKATYGETDNYNSAESNVAMLTIALGKLTVTAQGYTGAYDSQPHSITVKADTGATITYSTNGTEYSNNNPTYTDVGEYTVYYKVVKNNYETVTGSKTVKITPAQLTGVTAQGYTGAYDSQPHSITVTADEGATITYSTTSDGNYSEENLTYTGVGEYTVYYKVEKKNYETVTGSETVKITPAELTEVTASGYTGVYDGLPHAITVTADEGATITYSTTSDENYSEENPTYTDVGEYTVYYKVEKDNYNPVTGTLTVEITPATLTAAYVDETVYVGRTPALIVSVTGFVNGESAETAADYTAPTVTTTETVAGSYELTPSGGSARNYQFQYITGTLTIRFPSTTPTQTPSQQATDKIKRAEEGSTVEITLRTGQTQLDKEVFEELSGKDVTLKINLPGSVAWTVNGLDIPENADLTDLDLGVDLGTSGIDVDVINSVTGELGSVQITLAHDGEFGFALTLTAPLGKENAGYWANLYHYDEDAQALNFETSGKIDDEGDVALRMTHASQYAIVIDDKSHDLPFTDLGEGQWYEPAVRYAYTHGIMEGMSATTFVPAKSLTRAQAVQVLYNLEGQPTVSGNAAFPDLVEEWYKPAIAWAEQTGVVDGYEDGTFRPGQPVNRMEFAQMLYNYAQYKGCDLSAKGDLTAFPDGDSVQPWAETAMTWANGNQLINGHDDGTLEPGGTTTRAQAASILMRFDQNVVEN